MTPARKARESSGVVVRARSKTRSQRDDPRRSSSAAGGGETMPESPLLFIRSEAASGSIGIAVAVAVAPSSEGVGDFL